MKGIREEYKSAKQALLSNQSEKNYKELLSVCYEILVYYRKLCGEGEFAATLQLYEKAALSFWRRYKTAESLCHVVYFYSDWNILDYFRGLSDRKQHLLKGLKYVRQYHETEDADYSAHIYIRQYFSLGELCEGEEQLVYVQTACNLAKQYLQKYRTEQMLDVYKFVVKDLACICRMSGQKEDAEAAEREGKELAAVMKKEISRNVQGKNPDSEVLRFITEKIAERAARNAEFVMENRKEDVKRALGLVDFIRKKNRKAGILALEEAIADIKNVTFHAGNF